MIQYKYTLVSRNITPKVTLEGNTQKEIGLKYIEFTGVKHMSFEKINFDDGGNGVELVLIYADNIRKNGGWFTSEKAALEHYAACATKEFSLFCAVPQKA